MLAVLLEVPLPQGRHCTLVQHLHAAHTDARTEDTRSQGVVAIAGTFGDGTEEPVLKSSRQGLELPVFL